MTLVTIKIYKPWRMNIQRGVGIKLSILYIPTYTRNEEQAKDIEKNTPTMSYEMFYNILA